MRLIDAPIGIFRFDGELVLKTEYYSENKQSGKYIPDCYIVRTGEYFWGDAKTANELINLDVEPVDFAELLPITTDTISRQAAIDACGGYLVPANIIKQLPPTEPEPKRGKWIKFFEHGTCPYCGNCVDLVGGKENNFCSECGADLRGK